MFKRTNIELEFITNFDMNLSIEKGMRGGVRYIVQNQSQANNKYMKRCNKNKTSIYIRYLDNKKLYCQAMIQCRQSGGFKWVTYDQKKQSDTNSIQKDCKEGYT